MKQLYDGTPAERRRAAQKAWRERNPQTNRDRVRLSQWRARRQVGIEPQTPVARSLDQFREMMGISSKKQPKGRKKNV